MKVLYLAPQLPWPLDQGARIRNYYLLRALAAEHSVDLLCLDGGRATTPATDLDIGPLVELCRRVEVFPAPARRRAARLRTLVRSPLPDLAHRAWQPALARRLRDLLAGEPYDVAQLSSLEMIPYRRLLAGGRRPRVVFDDLNAEYQLQRRACLTDLGQPRRWHAALYSAVQWRRLRAYEGRVCREADTVIAVSDTDAAHLRRLAPAARLLVLPNGVDTTAFAYREPTAESGGPSDAAPTLLFTGTMDYRPNVDAMLWFAEAIWPRLRAAWPGLRCLIVGKAPDARLLAAARRQAGLEVTGAVPDVRPYLARAAVYVVPMRMGSGVRLKVLEAMAAGVPVVSTRMGLEGVAAVPGEHALLADPALAARLAARARGLVEERYAWTCLAPTLLTLYETLAGRATGDHGSSIGSSTWTV